MLPISPQVGILKSWMFTNDSSSLQFVSNLWSWLGHEVRTAFCTRYRVPSYHLQTSSPSSLSPWPCLLCQCQEDKWFHFFLAYFQHRMKYGCWVVSANFVLQHDISPHHQFHHTLISCGYLQWKSTLLWWKSPLYGNIN